MKAFINFFICLFSLSILSIFFYYRFTRKTYIINLDPILVKEHFYFFLSLLISSLILFTLILLVLVLKDKILHKNNKKPSKILVKLLVWYNKINIFYITYGIIFDFVGPGYQIYLVKFAKYFIEEPPKPYARYIFIFVVLPRLIILFILFVEIYLQQLHYYFYSLFLLIIPLLFKFVVFILKDLGSRLLPEFNKFIAKDISDETIYPIKTPDGLKLAGLIGLRMKPEHQDVDLDHFLYNFYFPVLYIEGELEVNFKPQYSSASTAILLIYLGLHGLACGYILITYF